MEFLTDLFCSNFTDIAYLRALNKKAKVLSQNFMMVR